MNSMSNYVPSNSSAPGERRESNCNNLYSYLFPNDCKRAAHARGLIAVVTYLASRTIQGSSMPQPSCRSRLSIGRVARRSVAAPVSKPRSGSAAYFFSDIEFNHAC